MAYYNVCPHCGCNLDPGEKCDCESIKAREQETSRIFYSQILMTDEKGVRWHLRSTIQKEVRCQHEKQMSF